jgi:hypothetical protein
VSQVQIVKGYICFDCADVALAQKGQNPAHPPGSVSNPTGATPNGPDPLNGAKAVDAGNAVTFGGALSGQAPSSQRQADASYYQPGAQVSVSA